MTLIGEPEQHSRLAGQAGGDARRGGASAGHSGAMVSSAGTDPVRGRFIVSL